MRYRRPVSEPDDAGPDPLIGQVIDDRYRIRRVLGRGGMGVVYEAEATRLGKRLCAVKVLLPEFTRSENLVARFTREALVAARVKHPNVVEIFDTGTTAAGSGYIAMELLRGESLRSLLRRERPLPWPRARHIVLQICRALAAAHAEQIVHRDMKPDNCFRCDREDDDDFIKVLDFGIAKLTAAGDDEDAPRLTATNSLLGTYAYMSHEQICGEEVDHRADVWAVGVILYEMLTGQRPFRGKDQVGVWRSITEQPLAPMRSVAPDAAIPEAIEPVVRQALAIDLAERHPTIEAFARAIASVQQDGSVRTFTGKLSAALPAASRRAAPADDPQPTGSTPDEDTAPTAGRARSGASPSLHEALPTATPARADAAPERGSRRAWLLLAALLLATVALAVVLSQRPGDPPTPTPEPVTTLAPPLTETPPTPPPEPVPEPAPTTAVVLEPPPEPPPDDAPAIPKQPGKKQDESFATRATRELRRLQSSQQLADCFTTYQMSSPMPVDVTVVAATGAATVTVPPLRRGSGLARCVEATFKKWKFPRGAAGDRDLVVPKYQLNLPR